MVKKYTFLLMLLCVGQHVGAMDVAPLQEMSDDKQFKLYGQEGEKQPIPISWRALKLSSTLTDMVEDLGGDNSHPIPLATFSRDEITRLVKVLELYTKFPGELEPIQMMVKDYSTLDMIAIINCANFLGVEDIILKVFGDRMGEIIKNNRKLQSADYTMLQSLQYDFAKSFVFPAVIPKIESSIKIITLKENKSDGKFFIKHAPSALKTKKKMPAMAYGESGIFLHDDTRIALSSFNEDSGTARLIIYDAVDHQKIQELPLNFHANKLVAYKNDYLVCSEYSDQFIRIFNIRDNKDIQYCDYTHPNRSSIVSKAFSFDGKYLVLACEGTLNNIVVLDMDGINWQASPPVCDPTKISFFTAHIGQFQGKVFFEPDSYKFWVVSGQDDIIKLSLVNCISGLRSFRSIKQKGVNFNVFGFSSDGKRIVVVNEFMNHRKIAIFDTLSMQKLYEFDGPPMGPHHALSIGFSPDDQWIVYASGKKLVVYDAADGALLGRVTFSGLWANRSLSFSFDSNKVLLSGLLHHSYSGMLWTLLTDDIIQKLYNCSVEQLMLVQQLCYQLTIKDGIATIEDNSVEARIFASLDKELQEFLIKIGVKIKSTDKKIRTQKLRRKIFSSKKG